MSDTSTDVTDFDVDDDDVWTENEDQVNGANGTVVAAPDLSDPTDPTDHGPAGSDSAGSDRPAGPPRNKTAKPAAKPAVKADDEAPDTKPSDTKPKSVSKADVERHVRITLVVADFADGTRETIAKIMGIKSTDRQSVASNLILRKNSMAGVVGLLELARMDPMTAGISAASGERHEIKRLWDVLVALGVVTGGLKSKRAESALQVASAASALPEHTLGELEGLLASVEGG